MSDYVIIAEGAGLPTQYLLWDEETKHSSGWTESWQAAGKFSGYGEAMYVLDALDQHIVKPNEHFHQGIVKVAVDRIKELGFNRLVFKIVRLKVETQEVNAVGSHIFIRIDQNDGSLDVTSNK